MSPREILLANTRRRPPPSRPAAQDRHGPSQDTTVSQVVGWPDIGHRSGGSSVVGQEGVSGRTRFGTARFTTMRKHRKPDETWLRPSWSNAICKLSTRKEDHEEDQSWKRFEGPDHLRATAPPRKSLVPGARGRPVVVRARTSQRGRADGRACAIRHLVRVTA